MRIDDRMGPKPDTEPLRCTCEAQEDGEIRRRNGSRDNDASSPTRFGSLLDGLPSREKPTGDRMGTKIEAGTPPTRNKLGRTFRAADS